MAHLQRIITNCIITNRHFGHAYDRCHQLAPYSLPCQTCGPPELTLACDLKASDHEDGKMMRGVSIQQCDQCYDGLFIAGYIIVIGHGAPVIEKQAVHHVSDPVM